MILKRRNSTGLIFLLTDVEESKTLIQLAGSAVRLPAKSVKVDLPIDEVDTRWYRWQMKGLLIQQAFDVLTSEQREFLISGMTPQEWKELFG